MTRHTLSGGLLLQAVAVYKFFKALVFVMAGLAALALMRDSVVESLESWSAALPFHSEQQLAQQFLGWITGLGPQRIRALGLGAFVYAVLFVVEGVGLMMRQPWAGWLTVLETALLIPLELWRLHVHPSGETLIVLVLNVLIVGYLVLQLRREYSLA